MRAAAAKVSRRLTAKIRMGARKKNTRSKAAPAGWTPPDFERRRQEDFGGKILSISYADFLER